MLRGRMPSLLNSLNPLLFQSRDRSARQSIGSAVVLETNILGYINLTGNAAFQLLE